MAKIKIENDTVTIEDKNDLISQMIAGCEGTITIKSPFIKGGKREIKSIKDSNGKEIGKKK